MIPKLHSKGSSFKGAAAYLLHDEGRADTSERVAWTTTRNLATSRPDMAWRIMAATAMNQAQLKAEAGVPNTGRKSSKHVLHLSLSWSPDEAGNVDREEMLRATGGALRALSAEDRQALIICHTDTPQPHVHILINRVSPQDGRMLSSSKEKLNLSRWAQVYEEERGKVYCEERVINNEARARGEYTRGTETSRVAYEREKRTGKDEESKRFLDSERKKDAAVAKAAREKKARMAAAWDRLFENHREALSAIGQKARRDVAVRQTAIRKRYKPAWRKLRRKQEEEERSFNEREKTLLGKAENTLKAFEMKKAVQDGGARRLISDSFRILASRGARRKALAQAQKQRRKKLLTRQKEEERRAAEEVEKEKAAALKKENNRFKALRADLILSHRMNGASDRAAWKQRERDREAALKSFEARRAFNRASSSSGGARDEAARRADLARAYRQQQERNRDKDRGRE